MAVNDLGYRAWNGRLLSGQHRALVVASTGVRRAWQSGWLRRMLFASWLPAAWFAIGFFFWERSLLETELRAGLRPFLRGLPVAQELMGGFYGTSDPDIARHTVWAWMLQSLFRYPQAILMVMVVGLIGPGLISQDIRSRAFLLYFSRPLNRFEYVAGKLVTLSVYLAMISTLPALVLYLLGVLLSPELSVVNATWDLPFRILAASAVLMIPTTILALCLSALTQESRIAAFAWFAIWILGWFTYGMMTWATQDLAQPLSQVNNVWTHVSLYHTLGNVQSWVFGFAEFRDVATSALTLTVVTAISFVILLRQVAAPMRV